MAEQRVRAVVFDIGETLLDRTREYAAWAGFFEVPAHTFSAVFGGMIAAGSKVAEVIESFAPGIPYSELLAQRERRGIHVELEERDLYPDVRETLREVRALGVAVGIAGNQPAAISGQLRGLDLGADFIASSTDWGVSKPNAEFFVRAAMEAGAAPGETVYVGDQLDNDVVAPQRAGLRSVRIIRGPWGYLTRDAAAPSESLAVIHSLRELAGLLESDSGKS
jgi:HAD superfamily hydrolase (TIGR01549 family)